MIERLVISLSAVRLDLFQIIMLNSVSDLHGYIDKSQLTRELGGTLEYGHSQWIHHRTVSAAVLTHLHHNCPRDKCRATMKQALFSCITACGFCQGLRERANP